ncbi:MAG: hypothetical protein AB8I08_02415 [Sandaracinaceae bacterium]
MTDPLATAVAVLEDGARRNRNVQIGAGIFLLAMGALAFVVLDPAELGGKAYLGRLLVGPLGIGAIVFAFIRKPKALAALREQPENIVRWSIQPHGNRLPLVLALRDGTSVSQDLNVQVANQLRPLLAQALPSANA